MIWKCSGHTWFLPPATKFGQGYIFTGVCDSVNRGGCFLRGGPGGDPPGTPTAADGTHPTGMHSPSKEIISGKTSLLLTKKSYNQPYFLVGWVEYWSYDWVTNTGENQCNPSVLVLFQFKLSQSKPTVDLCNMSTSSDANTDINTGKSFFSQKKDWLLQLKGKSKILSIFLIYEVSRNL